MRAAGKGGCIKRLVQGIDPRSYHVTPLELPPKTNFATIIFGGFGSAMPRPEAQKIFDRSWYGRVLVERVERLCTNREWRRAYQEINEMEAHLTDFGTVVLKILAPYRQRNAIRAISRASSQSLKEWKITDEDWRNREKWDLYEEAVNEMVKETDQPHAPWKIVSSVCKMSARIETIDLRSSS